MKSVNDAFGQYLKEVRTIRGLTQEELSFQSGLHRTYISLLERGKKSPTLETLFKICDTLDFPVDKFVSGVIRNTKK